MKPDIQSIPMVDLKTQYQRLQSEMDQAILDVVRSSRFIKGPVVQAFEEELASYLDVKHVVACANGTDALQIATMALDLQQDDEVIVPAFTYVATAEIIGLLKLKPTMVDVDPQDFNVTVEAIEKAVSDRTRAIVPVHLFGQAAPMEQIMDIAEKHDLYVIEDNAQAIGADITYRGHKVKTGTIGHFGTTSFFPSKNLGCYGDGGAIFTNDDNLAEKLRMIANHGQSRQYYHDVLGVNSRLDAIQAAILRVKLPHLDAYCEARRGVADRYDEGFSDIPELITPFRAYHSSHVFHQYTLKVPADQRPELRKHLATQHIPSMIYYPVPLYKQAAYAPYWPSPELTLPVTESLCSSVISLPIHTEMDPEVQNYIISKVKDFFV